MIRKIVWATAALLLAGPVLAADNKTAKDAAGSNFTLGMTDHAGVFVAKHHCITLGSLTTECSTATETKLDTIDTRVDGLETAVASTNTKLDTLITDLGTLRTAIGTSASASDCDGSAASMSYQLCAAINLAAIAADTTPLQTYGAADTITVTFNRPADANSYTALDMIADSTTAPTAGGFTITGACRGNGGSVVIPDVWIMSNDTAALIGKILLLDTAVTTTPNDNAAEALSDADAAKIQAEIPFTLAARANSASAHVQNLNIQAKCLSGATTLKFLVQATGGTLTTVSANTYTFKFKIIQVN